MLLTAGLRSVCGAVFLAPSDAERSKFCSRTSAADQSAGISVGSDPRELLPEIYRPGRTKRDSLCHEPARHTPPTLNFWMFASLPPWLQEQVQTLRSEVAFSCWKRRVSCVVPRHLGGRCFYVRTLE